MDKDGRTQTLDTANNKYPIKNGNGLPYLYLQHAALFNIIFIVSEKLTALLDHMNSGCRLPFFE